MLRAASLIVLLFKARESARMLIPLESVSPARIMYRNTIAVLLSPPEAYVAVRLSLPTARVSVGFPLELSTMKIGSLKVAVTDTLSVAFKKLF